MKYGLLGAVVVYFLVTQRHLVYRYVEPFWMFAGQATTGMWIGLGDAARRDRLRQKSLLPVSLSGRRDLGLLSSLTVFRIKRWSECKTCKICEKTCEWGAIRGPKIVEVASACAAMTASGSTWTSRSARTGSSSSRRSRDAGAGKGTLA